MFGAIDRYTHENIKLYQISKLYFEQSATGRHFFNLFNPLFILLTVKWNTILMFIYRFFNKTLKS